MTGAQWLWLIRCVGAFLTLVYEVWSAIRDWTPSE